MTTSRAFLPREGEDHVDAGKYAVALVDTRERVDAAFYNTFPEFDPEVRKKKMEEANLRAGSHLGWAILSPWQERAYTKFCVIWLREERELPETAVQITRERYRANSRGSGRPGLTTPARARG